MKPTNIRSKIHGLEDLDAEIRLYFADNFGGIVEGEVRILLNVNWLSVNERLTNM